MSSSSLFADDDSLNAVLGAHDNLGTNSSEEEGSEASSDDDESSAAASSREHYSENENERADLMDMIEQAFTGSKISDWDNDDDSVDSVNKLCYRLATSDTTLTRIDIDVVSIGNKAEDIAAALASSNRLEKLSFSYNDDQLGEDEDEELGQHNFKTLCRALAINSSINGFQMQSTELKSDVASLLGSALAENRTVQKICLKNCNFVGPGLAILFMGMQHSKRIQDLIILSCNLSSIYNSDVVAASLPLMKLESLTLVNTNIAVEGLRFLCDSIERAPDLKELDLSGNKLGRRIRLLMPCLTSPRQKLRKLVLSSCGLDDSCVHKLAKGLAEKQSLASLNLSDNDFGDPGAVSLKRLLEKNNSIKELIVDGCRISKKKWKSIADGLRYNKTFLKSLFSETTSLEILESVEMIQNLGASRSGTAARVVSPER